MSIASSVSRPYVVIYRRDTSKRWVCVRAQNPDQARKAFDSQVKGKFLYEIQDIHLAGEDETLPRNLADKTDPPIPDGAPVPPFRVSCGCCPDGCVCWNHQDTPRGEPHRVCAYHRWQRTTEGYR